MKKLLPFLALFLGAGALLSGCFTQVDESTLNVYTQGNPEASVIVQEYSDFQCPYCAIHSTTTVKQLLDEFGDDIRFEFRHYPLRGHEHAQTAALAAEAAGMQDKFWPMHDLIYLNQKQWSNADNPKDMLKGYAESLDLDMEKYMKDVSSAEAKASISRDLRLGNSKGVNATPTFYINNNKFESSGGNYYQELAQAVRTAVQESKSTENTDNTDTE